MTPLLTAEGWTVYVNRGFVPPNVAIRTSGPKGNIAGRQP